MTARRANSSSPQEDRRLVEALEVYRPGCDDPADSALAPLLDHLRSDASLAETQQRLQQLDAVVAEVMQDVPLPDGLEQRLLDRLNAAVVRRQSPGVRMVRRRWLPAVAAVAAAVLLGAFFLVRPSVGPSEAEILAAAVAVFDQTPPGLGQPLADATTEVLETYPPSHEIVTSADTRWRKIDDLLGRRGVAYEMSCWGGGRATLYVVRCETKLPELGATPPSQPRRATGGRAAAAWQTDERLYVLVVQGDAAAYRSLLNPGRPLT